MNFGRFAAVLDESLRGKTWLVGERLTIADFPVGGARAVSRAPRTPIESFPEIMRWYAGLTALRSWQNVLASQDAAMADWMSKNSEKLRQTE